MIVVRVELWSARTGQKSELARMHICNDEETTLLNHRRGAYNGETFVGRSSQDLDRKRVSKAGRVESFPRLDLHVWNLVARMLVSMGYK
jgi:hypothetical protein